MNEFNIEVQGGSSVRLPIAGKYCDRDIIVTTSGSGEDSLIKANELSDIQNFEDDKIYLLKNGIPVDFYIYDYNFKMIMPFSQFMYLSSMPIPEYEITILNEMPTDFGSLKESDMDTFSYVNFYCIKNENIFTNYIYLGGQLVPFTMITQQMGITFVDLGKINSLAELTQNRNQHSFGVFSQDNTLLVPENIANKVVLSSQELIGPEKLLENSLIKEIKEEDFGNATSLRAYCFYDCDFEKVKISDKIITIGMEAFSENSSLVSVTLGRNTINFGSYIFKSCRNLTEIKFLTNPLSLGYTVLSGCTNSDLIIYVPWSESDSINVNAPWGATPKEIVYNVKYDDKGNIIN